MDLFEKVAATIFAIVALLLFAFVDYGNVRYSIPAEPNKLSQIGLSLLLLGGNILVGSIVYILLHLAFSDHPWRSPLVPVVFAIGFASLFIGLVLWNRGSPPAKNQ